LHSCRLLSKPLSTSGIAWTRRMSPSSSSPPWTCQTRASTWIRASTSSLRCCS
ncbi:unnamed protein product, partial [Symbiodinium pilosum]